jgi:chromate reductase, NAD(P)H dehydrogenase (quinone)
VFLNMPPLQMPEVYLGGAYKLFDAEGKLIADKTSEFLSKFLQAYAAWVERHMS